MKSKLTLLAPSAIIALLVSAAGSRAADQVVTDLGDSGGPNQLRQKITDCQSTGGGKITFGLAGTVYLQLGYLPVITSNVTIDGGNKVTISGNNDDGRIFIVNSGATFTLNKITVRDGYCSTGDGGALLSYGKLYVNNSKLIYNRTSPSWSGSAIHNWGQLYLFATEIAYNTGGGGAVKPRSSGALTSITSCNFHDNSSTSSSGGGYGGAMQLHDAPQVIIASSTFSNNSAAAQGGAVYVNGNSTLIADKTAFTGNSALSGGAMAIDGVARLTKSTLTGNSAQGGGAIFLGQAFNGGQVYLIDATLSGNKASEGGAVYQTPDGWAAMTNTTISGNSAGNGGGICDTNGGLSLANVTISGNSVTGYGGGVVCNAGPNSFTNVTITGNSAGAAGGGIYANSGEAMMLNTLVAKNPGGNFGSSFDTTIFGDHNLSDDNTFGFAGRGIGADNVTNLLLGPLANNGGLTMTHMPQPGSAAIDAGTSNGAPSTDQRGVTRPQLAGFDVGAVEYLPLIDSTSKNIQYDGWVGISDRFASGGYYRASHTANDMISYGFGGTSIKWITRKGPEMGVASVVIDGVNKGNFDLYNSSTLWAQQVLFSGLPSGAHRIAITVTGTKNPLATDSRVAVDGFIVGTSTVQESANDVQYNNWASKSQTAAIGGSYRSNGTLGSFARFNFNGSSISFVTARGPSYGNVNIYIDGVLMSSNIDLYSSTQQWQYTLQYSGLTNANHTIEVRPTHTKNVKAKGYNVVVDAFTGPFTALP